MSDAYAWLNFDVDVLPEKTRRPDVYYEGWVSEDMRNISKSIQAATQNKKEPSNIMLQLRLLARDKLAGSSFDIFNIVKLGNIAELSPWKSDVHGQALEKMLSYAKNGTPKEELLVNKFVAWFTHRNQTDRVGAVRDMANERILDLAMSVNTVNEFMSACGVVAITTISAKHKATSLNKMISRVDELDNVADKFQILLFAAREAERAKLDDISGHAMENFAIIAAPLPKEEQAYLFLRASAETYGVDKNTYAFMFERFVKTTNSLDPFRKVVVFGDAAKMQYYACSVGLGLESERHFTEAVNLLPKDSDRFVAFARASLDALEEHGPGGHFVEQMAKNAVNILKAQPFKDQANITELYMERTVSEPDRYPLYGSLSPYMRRVKYEADMERGHQESQNQHINPNTYELPRLNGHTPVGSSVTAEHRL